MSKSNSKTPNFQAIKIIALKIRKTKNKYILYPFDMIYYNNTSSKLFLINNNRIVINSKLTLQN